MEGYWERLARLNTCFRYGLCENPMEITGLWFNSLFNFLCMDCVSVHVCLLTILSSCEETQAEVKETAEGQWKSRVAFEVSPPEVLDIHLRSGNP